MAKAKPLSEDMKWKAESDARTLREAEEIRMDAPRYKRAVTELQKLEASAKKALQVAGKAKVRSLADLKKLAEG